MSNMEETTRVDLSRSTSSSSSDSRLPPLLIFNHNPKAGGGSIKDVLNELKPIKISCKCKPFNASAVYDLGDARRKNLCCREADTVDARKSDALFVNVDEFSRTPLYLIQNDESIGRSSFVIGSIREPCSQYLSLWSYGSQGEGYFMQRFITKQPANLYYGQNPPYFNTSEDVERFRNWMSHDLVTGLVGDRIWASYATSLNKWKNPSEGVLQSVDCWVVVENFRETLLNCLRAYETKGGLVDWSLPTVSNLVRQEQEFQKAENERHNSRRLYTNSKDKNDALHDPRSKHHSPCAMYFDNSTEHLVQDGKEAFVYGLFGYKGCCEPGNSFLGARTARAVDEETTTNTGNLPAPPNVWSNPLEIALSLGLVAVALYFGLARRTTGRKTTSTTQNSMVVAAGSKSASTDSEEREQELQQFLPKH